MAAPFAFVEAFKCPTADLRAGRLGLVLTSDGSHRWVLTCFHVLARPGGGIVDGDLLFQPDHHTSAIGELRRRERTVCSIVRRCEPRSQAQMLCAGWAVSRTGPFRTWASCLTKQPSHGSHRRNFIHV
jgi:hypothetical protein